MPTCTVRLCGLIFPPAESARQAALAIRGKRKPDKLGKLIWEVAKALIAAAAGTVTFYHTMTGKLPP